MDNKTILQIIKKDLEELRILVDALENAKDQEQLLIDITAAKAKTLLQEFSLLKSAAPSNELIQPVVFLQPADEMTVEQPEPVEKEEQIQQVETVAIENIAEVIDEPVVDQTALMNTEELIPIAEETPAVMVVTEIEEIAIAEEIMSIEQVAPVETTPEPIIVEQPEIIEEEIEQPQVEVICDEEQVLIEEVVLVAAELNEEPSLQAETKSSFLSEPEPDNNGKKVFGEQFTKEPSLNDRLSSMKNIEPKIKAQPITSIRAAIGLNDRFMFTRELFGNVNAKYEATIEALDNAGNIIEAVEHLEQNFKWQKNDTSLKFLDLVKRRFDK